MISIQNVTKSFKGKNAIKQLSIEIAEGEIMGLLGANGAGKSTTINMILGFIKPDSGKASVNDLDTSSQYLRVRRNDRLYSRKRKPLPLLNRV